MPLNLANSALLSADVLVDANRMLESPADITPADLHALNSLVEAAVLHDKLYVFEAPKDASLGFGELFTWGLIEKEPVATACEAALRARDLKDLANQILIDRGWGHEFVSYSPQTLVDTLEALVDYETVLGFARMSSLLDGEEGVRRVATRAAQAARFTADDTRVLDASYRRMRATGTAAMELGLHLYTGLISRPFVLDLINVKRNLAKEVFDKLKEEFDDWDDTDIPQWRRIRVPALTQTMLNNCKDDPDAIPHEIMRLRHQLQDFRSALTQQAAALSQANTRGEKRQIRLDAEAALAAAISKMETSERLVHKLWDIAKNPLTAHQKVGDRLLAKDRLDQAVDKVHGLTDLYALLRDAPTTEQNAQIIRRLFKVTCDHRQWSRVQRVAEDLEALMRRDTEPDLPGDSGGSSAR